MDPNFLDNFLEQDRRKLAGDALAVQDACNLCGVAQTFAKVMLELGDHCNGSDERNQHVIAKAWLYKMCDLAKITVAVDDWADALHECLKLRDGNTNNG